MRRRHLAMGEGGICSCFPGSEFNTESKLCDACGDNQYSVGGPSCIECSAGQKSNEYKNDCERCPPGTARSRGGVDCSNCPSGTEPNGDQSACVDCLAGKYGWGGECNQCTPTTYSNEDGAVSCENCPLGQISNENYTDCENCPPGTYRSGGWFRCVNCPRNTYSEEGAVSCTPHRTCDVGSVLIKSGTPTEDTVCSTDYINCDELRPATKTGYNEVGNPALSFRVENLWRYNDSSFIYKNSDNKFLTIEMHSDDNGQWKLYRQGWMQMSI